MPIITELNSVEAFSELLINNPGLVVIKFGATWCGPCKVIEADVNNFFLKAPPQVQCVMIDIDQCPKVYSYLKTKKMVNGVPAIVCYYKGNTKYIPDDYVIGANKEELYKFFTRCYHQTQVV